MVQMARQCHDLTVTLRCAGGRDELHGKGGGVEQDGGWSEVGVMGSFSKVSKL